MALHMDSCAFELKLDSLSCLQSAYASLCI